MSAIAGGIDSIASLVSLSGMPQQAAVTKGTDACQPAAALPMNGLHSAGHLLHS